MYKSSYDNSKNFLEFKMVLKWLEEETIENSLHCPNMNKLKPSHTGSSVLSSLFETPAT